MKIERSFGMGLLAGGLSLVTGCIGITRTVHTGETPSAVSSAAVYCKQCGVLPGTPTACPNYSSHQMTSSKQGSRVVCSHCGAVPAAEPTKCPTHSSHQFHNY